MPEITLAGVLFAMGFNLLGLMLLIREQITPPKPQNPEQKKRMSVSTIAYMILGSNLFIFFYIWWEFFQLYIVFQNLPLSLSLGVMGGSILAWWMKKYLASPAQANLEKSLLKKNARWHRLYFLQALTIWGGLLMVLSVEMMTPISLLGLAAGLLASLLHFLCRDWKNTLFHFIYNAVWMVVCLLTLEGLSIFIAMTISYVIVRVLIIKGHLS